MGDQFSKLLINSENRCPIHKIPYIGICGERDCYRTGLICSKCNQETCIKTLGHRMITIEEFYTRYIKKLLYLVDFKELNLLIKTGLEIQKKKLELQEEAFEKWEIDMINEKFEKFRIKILNKFEEYKRNLIKKLEEINKDFINSNKELNSSSYKDFNGFKLKDTVKFINENKENKEELEKFLETIKKYMDNDKLLKSQETLKNVIYGKFLSDYLESFGGTEKILSLSSCMEDYVKNIMKAIFPNKDYFSIFPSQKLTPFTSEPEDLKYHETLTTKSPKSYTIDSLFDVFNAFDGNCYLATLVSSKNDIEVYDLKLNSLRATLKGHVSHPYIVRHFPQYFTGTDYLLSTSTSKDVRVWNLNSFTIYQTVKNCHSGTYLYSALLLFDDSHNYIVTTCPNEYMKLWNMDTGTFIREIGSNSDYTYFINSWNNKSKNKNYIINANSDSVRIYGMEKSRDLYGQYTGDTRTWHMSAFVESLGSVDYLFESDGNGIVRLWNLETNLIFKKIECPSCNLRGLCFWNKTHLIVASSDKTVKIINFMEEKVVASFGGFHTNSVCTAIKIKHPKYGESLLTGSIDGTIRLWINKNFTL